MRIERPKQLKTSSNCQVKSTNLVLKYSSFENEHNKINNQVLVCASSKDTQLGLIINFLFCQYCIYQWELVGC